MISNEHQYKVTKGKIDDLQRVLDTLDAEQADLPPLMIEATRKGFLLKISVHHTLLVFWSFQQS